MVRLPIFEMRGLRKNTPSNFKNKNLIHTTIQRSIIRSEEMESFRRLSQAVLLEVLCQRDDGGRERVVHRTAINCFARFPIASGDLTPAHEHIVPCPPRAPNDPP